MNSPNGISTILSYRPPIEPSARRRKALLNHSIRRPQSRYATAPNRSGAGASGYGIEPLEGRRLERNPPLDDRLRPDQQIGRGRQARRQPPVARDVGFEQVALPLLVEQQVALHHADVERRRRRDLALDLRHAPAAVEDDQDERGERPEQRTQPRQARDTRPRPRHDERQQERAGQIPGLQQQRHLALRVREAPREQGGKRELDRCPQAPARAAAARPVPAQRSAAATSGERQRAVERERREEEQRDRRAGSRRSA